MEQKRRRGLWVVLGGLLLIMLFWLPIPWFDQGHDENTPAILSGDEEKPTEPVRKSPRRKGRAGAVREIPRAKPAPLKTKTPPPTPEEVIPPPTIQKLPSANIPDIPTPEEPLSPPESFLEDIPLISLVLDVNLTQGIPGIGFGVNLSPELIAAVAATIDLGNTRQSQLGLEFSLWFHDGIAGGLAFDVLNGIPKVGIGGELGPVTLLATITLDATPQVGLVGLINF